MKLTIETERADRDDMAIAARYIADLIDKGYTSGTEGALGWELEE